jgi:uncharacterized protein (TIGR04255 family)
MAPYVGWETFRSELAEAIAALFEKADGLSIRRLGLRYLNALLPAAHGIHTMSELDLRLAVADEDVMGNANVNFTTSLSDDTQCTVRIATADYRHMYAWVLKNARKLAWPVEYQHPSGAVIWVRLETVVEKKMKAQLGIRK